MNIFIVEKERKVKKEKTGRLLSQKISIPIMEMNVFGIHKDFFILIIFGGDMKVQFLKPLTHKEL